MMKSMVVSIALLWAVPALADDAAQLPGWLSGSWTENRTGGAWAEEYWTAPRAGIMLGAARMGDADTLWVFEFTRIERDAAGVLTFNAQPRGVSAVAFPMVAMGDAMIEFANPAHDYPQRIRYWREGENLRARISLMDGSKPAEWRYQPMYPNPN